MWATIRSVLKRSANTHQTETETIKAEITAKIAEIDAHWAKLPPIQDRCSQSDKTFYKTDVKLHDELSVLHHALSKTGMRLLNMFPAGVACTMEHVAANVGIEVDMMYLLWEEDENVEIYAPLDCCDALNDHGWTSVEVESATEAVTCEHNAGYTLTIRRRMKVPNWRFVSSVDTSILYIERIDVTT